MKIGIAKERRAHELRVAVSPDTVKKLIALGAEVVVETGAGLGAAYTDATLAEAGAKIVADEKSAIGDADIVLKVQRPLTAAEGGPDEMALLKSGAMLVGILAPYAAKEQVAAMVKLQLGMLVLPQADAADAALDARALGLAIPSTFLARADEVIE